MSISKVKMLQVSKCLIGLAVVMLQSCDVTDDNRDRLCGNWESVEGKPDVLIYKEGEAYKVTVFKRSGLRRKLKPETYLLQEIGFRFQLAAQTAPAEHRHLVGFALLVDKHIGLPLHALPVPAQHITAVIDHIAGLQHHDRQSDQALADLQHFNF